MNATPALGEQLRAAGVTARRLAAWCGTDRLSARPLTGPWDTPAGEVLAAFVAGTRIAARARYDGWVEAGLLGRSAGSVAAPLAIAPLGENFIVCDHRGRPDRRDLVAWPDDSSYHLARAIPPGRRARWIDLGCGSAFAQLARPELAGERVAIDANPRAIACATAGARLSNVAIDAHLHDLAALPALAPAELVTCNAPLPDVPDRAIWRRAGDGFFAGLWPAIRACLAPGGLAVVHLARAALPDELPGERLVLAYAPDLVVLWWRPDAAGRVRHGARDLTLERPHVDARDHAELSAC